MARYDGMNGNCYGCAEGLTSLNFANATNKILPSKVYVATIRPVVSMVPFDECLSFMTEQGALLTGAHGITLAISLAPNRFPKSQYGTSTYSFDEKENLWMNKHEGLPQVPYVNQWHDGDIAVGLARYKGTLPPKNCLFYLTLAK